MQILDHGKGYGRTVLCKYANSDWLSKIKRQCLTANNATEASLNRLRIDAIKLHRLDKNLSAVNIDLTPDDLSEIIEAMYTRKGHNLAFLPEVAQLKSARREYNYQASVGFNRKERRERKVFLLSLRLLRPWRLVVTKRWQTSPLSATDIKLDTSHKCVG